MAAADHRRRADASKLRLARARPRTRSRAASETVPGQFRATSSVGRWRRGSWMDINIYGLDASIPLPETISEPLLERVGEFGDLLDWQFPNHHVAAPVPDPG